MYSAIFNCARNLTAAPRFPQVYYFRFGFSALRRSMTKRRSTRISSRIVAEEEHIVKNASGQVQVEGRTSGSVLPLSKSGRQGKRKASREEPVLDGGESKAPQTPKKRYKVAPVTPTATVGGVVVHEEGAPKNQTHRPRRAEPHATNAPLQTPGGSHVLKKYSSDLLNMSPSQAHVADFTTTENLLAKACEHLCSVDPRLEAVIDKHHCKLFSPEGLQEVVDPFVALSSSIISQQVSGAAAASIKNKFIGLFPPPTVPNPKHFPAASEVAAADISFLRTAGLSLRKAEYIQGLAEKFASGELSAPMLVEASDEELLEKLIAVRGLGRWSVEMFACFALKRMDIFSTGDLGVQRGMAAYIGKDVSKLKAKGGGKWKYMSEKDMLDIANKFVPYRSLFMWYMWRIEDVNLAAIEGS